MAWRFVILTSNGGTHAWTLQSVDRLRAAHQWALTAYSRHQIDDWQWWTLPPEPPDTTCPQCGQPYAPGRAHTDLCQCGHPHHIYACPRCPQRVDPAPGDGCAPIPFDPDAHRRRPGLQRRPR